MNDLTKRDSQWTIRAYTVALLAIIALQVFFIASPIMGERFAAAYLAPLTVALMTWLALSLGRPRKPVSICSILLALWYPVTCVINGDRYLEESAKVVYPMLFACCALYPAAFVLDSERRARFLKAVAAIVATGIGVIAWIAVVAAVTGKPVSNPFTGAIIGINETYTYPSYRLNVFDMHPNFSACLFYTALALLIYLMLMLKRRWLLAPCLLLCVGLYCAISLTVSNTAIIVTSLMLGLLTFAWIATGKERNGKRWLIGAVAALLVMGVTFASFPLSLKGMNALASRLQAQPESVETVVDSDASEAQSVVFVKKRTDDTTSVASRLKIYASTIPSIKQRPQTLLTGELLASAMSIPCKVLHYTELYHMHNVYLQALMVAGLPEMLLALGFTVLLVIQMIRLYFCRAASLAVKSLVLLPVALLCHGMLECFLFVDARLPNMLFFLMAGMVIAYSAELCPKRKRDSVQ